MFSHWIYVNSYFFLSPFWILWRNTCFDTTLCQAFFFTPFFFFFIPHCSFSLLHPVVVLRWGSHILCLSPYLLSFLFLKKRCIIEVGISSLFCLAVLYWDYSNISNLYIMNIFSISFSISFSFFFEFHETFSQSFHPFFQFVLGSLPFVIISLSFEMLSSLSFCLVLSIPIISVSHSCCLVYF